MIEASEKFTVFKFLQEQQVPLTKKILNQLQLGTKERKKTAFTATYLALFPGQPSKKKFEGDLFDRIDAIRKCFQEILEENRGKKEPIDLSRLPTTRDFFNNKIKSTRITNAVYLRSLSAYSYGTLPSPACGLRYPLFPAKLLKEMVEERKVGLNILISKLEPKKRGEEKGEEEKQSSVKEDFALAKLLYSDAALGAEDRNPIFFHDLLVTWAEGISEREACIESIFRQLNIGKWSSQELQIHKEFKTGRDGSFQQFLISCTIQYVEDKLGFPFLLPTLERMQNAFEDEQVRAHVAYFVALEDSVFLHDKLGAPAHYWIVSLQIFKFFRKKYGVASEKMAPLLEMILSRAPSRNTEKNLSGFSDIFVAAGEEDYTFTEAWNCMESCLCSILRLEEITWTPLSQELEKLLEDPELFPFFVYLHTQKQTWTLARWAGIFSSLKNFVNFSVSMIYVFFKANPDLSDPDVANYFSQSMSALIKEIKKKREDFDDFAFLCFTPPMVVKDASLREIRGREEETLNDFFATLPEVFLEKEEKAEENKQIRKEVQKLLRCRVFEERNYLFMLRLFNEDLKELEIFNPLRPLAIHILTSQFKSDKEPSLEQRREAIAIVMQIQESIPLPRKERFDLYLEVLRLKIHRQEVQLRKMSAFIEKLRGLCPSLNPLFFFYLLIHHPDPSFEALEELIRLREEIIREDLQKLYIPDEKSKAFRDKIEEVLAPIRDSFPGGMIADLKHTLTQTTLCFFQPITDFCKKIENFEFLWQLPGDIRHWGQCKSKYREATYSNWILNFEGFPQLFMMIYDPQKHYARSASVVLKIHKTEFDPLDKEKRKDFMHCLGECANFVFHEDMSLQHIDNQVADPHWSQNEKVRQGLIYQSHMDRIVEFVKSAKTSSRFLFFPEVEQKLSFDTLETAAQGSIYPIGRGSLLPPSQYLIETHRECYLPDANEDFIQECIRTKIKPFPDDAQEREFGLSLRIMGTIGKAKTIPISFEVLTEINAMRKKSSRQPHKDTEEDANKDVRYVVLSFTLRRKVSVPMQYFPEHLNDLAAFQKRFDLHNLILKALAYQFELSRPEIVRGEEEKKAQ